MNYFEKARYIDQFLEVLNVASYPISFAEGIELMKSSTEENIEKIKTLELTIEELGLVTLIKGRDNSTLNGRCEYKISKEGRKLVEQKESSLTLLIVEDVKSTFPEIYDEKLWDLYFDEKIDKRVREADLFFDLLISKNILKIDKTSLKNHFKIWYKENMEFDLQIKNGDLVIEDGDLQMLPDFEKKDISNFLKWFNSQGDVFFEYLKSQGVNIENDGENKIINNNGNFYINNNSNIKNQNPQIKKNTNQKESNWNKLNVVTAIVALVVTIILGIWGILK